MFKLKKKASGLSQVAYFHTLCVNTSSGSASILASSDFPAFEIKLEENTHQKRSVAKLLGKK